MLEAAIGDLVVEIRLVLKRIGVEFAIRQRLVRHDIIREFQDLDVEPLGRSDFLHLFHDLCMRAWRDADLDGFGCSRCREGRGEGGGEDDFFHRFSPWD